jgi:DNA-binding CsgD family transcriptional regulator
MTIIPRPPGGKSSVSTARKHASKVAARPAVQPAPPPPPPKQPAHRPSHAPTEADRTKVYAWTAYGLDQDQICLVLGIAKKTLQKHYRKELDRAAILAQVQIVQSLYNRAKAGDVNAIKFYLQNRAPGQWSEKLTVVDGGTTEDFRKLSDAEIEARQAKLLLSHAVQRVLRNGTTH